MISYIIQDPMELNLSYMPFVNHGGLFIPTSDDYSLGDRLLVDLQLPGQMEPLRIEGIVVWITPKNALHHVLSGVGIQFSSAQAEDIRRQIEASLDAGVEVGGYTYGITEELKK